MCLDPGISIHALREESDIDTVLGSRESGISIHALREESDPYASRMRCQSLISIHALREESDAKRWPSPTWTAYFYPRSP